MTIIRTGCAVKPDKPCEVTDRCKLPTYVRVMVVGGPMTMSIVTCRTHVRPALDAMFDLPGKVMVEPL